MIGEVGAGFAETSAVGVRFLMRLTFTVGLRPSGMGC